eukprot:scaffold24027_cov101-Isochrysis_galbana.AAC.2
MEAMAGPARERKRRISSTSPTSAATCSREPESPSAIGHGDTRSVVTPTSSSTDAQWQRLEPGAKDRAAVQAARSASLSVLGDSSGTVTSGVVERDCPIGSHHGDSGTSPQLGLLRHEAVSVEVAVGHRSRRPTTRPALPPVRRDTGSNTASRLQEAPIPWRASPGGGDTEFRQKRRF